MLSDNNREVEITSIVKLIEKTSALAANTSCPSFASIVIHIKMLPIEISWMSAIGTDNRNTFLVYIFIIDKLDFHVGILFYHENATIAMHKKK